jgi:membrane-associated phospholipid phosphatase
MFSLGAGLILTRTAPAIGAVTAVLDLGAGWARIWLGVHFPVDVLAAIPVGILAGGVARLIQPGLRRHALPPAACLYDQILTSLRLPATMFPRDAS